MLVSNNVKKILMQVKSLSMEIFKNSKSRDLSWYIPVFGVSGTIILEEGSWIRFVDGLDIFSYVSNLYTCKKKCKQINTYTISISQGLEFCSHFSFLLRLETVGHILR